MADEELTTDSAPAAAPAEPPKGETAEPKGATTPLSAPQGDTLTTDAPATPQHWPDNWQTLVAGEDEKLAKLAGRYASPKEVFNALVAAQAKIRSGELKPTLPKDAKPEEIAKWREEAGIPATPDKYELPVGLVLGDEDKPVIEGYLKMAHETNTPPEQVKATVDWWFKQQQAQADAREEQDRAQMTETQDALIAEWGSNFRRNLNLVESLLSHYPESVRDAMKSARLPDGTALFNSPDVMRGFANLALELNPAGTVVPAGGDQARGIDDEIASIEKTMRTNRAEYNRDDKMQARYRELLMAKEKLQKRAS